MKSTFATTSFFALCGLFLTVPFNMGGCAESGLGIGSIGVGGTSIDVDRAFAGGAKMWEAGNISPQDEDRMGQTVAVSVTSKYPLKADPALTKYVTLVGLTIASVSDRPDGNYVFGIVESTAPNAFTGPNGYIMVTTGALKLVQNEAELAGILAHEISHSVNQDGLKAAKNAGFWSGLAEAGTSAGGAQAFGSVASGLSDAVMVKGYDRSQETSADKSAVKLLIAAGYDPNAYKNFLTRMRAGQTSGSTQIWSTHPGLDERIKAISAQIPPGQTGAILKDRFDKNVASVK